MKIIASFRGVVDLKGTFPTIRNFRTVVWMDATQSL
jgi:hypothetical protein